MDKLLGWVKQIFVISILSELVIHILPDEKYEGVVRLLCGCMITAACIMPVLNIINAEYDADIGKGSGREGIPASGLYGSSAGHCGSLVYR